ncbi:MAG: ABC transporter permease [Clostridia bacterium]|nr:MAG: ABC transporter permease [Clostridia bacterium]
MKTTKSIGIYILRGITLLIAVAIFSFALAQISPVDPVRQYIQANPGVSAENVEAMKEYWGLNDPPVERFFKWFSAVLHGDWGYSTTFRQPVLQVIGIRFKTSLALMMTAWTFSGVLGFAIGCIMALFRDRLFDRIVKRICLVMCSVPTFWIGLVFLAVFSAILGWFPFGLAVPAGVPAEAVTLGQRIHHLILPALTLSFLSFANLALHTREKLLEVYDSDYALFAQARGDSDLKILFKHGIRNSLLPAITMQFGSFGELFGGSMFAENIFSYPGLGAATSAAGTGGTDIPLFLGIVLFTSIFIFTGNLMANILYQVVDPQTREGVKK